MSGDKRGASAWIDMIRNGLLLGVLWLAYRTVRSITEGTESNALRNANRLLNFQRRVGLDIESDLQHLLDIPSVLVAANSYYLMHFPVTVFALVVTFLRDRPGAFVALRNGLIVVTGIALVIHAVVPLAPPRMLTGFIDTGAAYGPDPYSLPGTSGANQFAAMPSMHVAWAILVAAALLRLTTRTPLRLIVLMHPLLTSFVVIVTAHHFIADVLIGAALAGIAMLAGLAGGRGSRAGALRWFAGSSADPDHNSTTFPDDASLTSHRSTVYSPRRLSSINAMLDLST